MPIQRRISGWYKFFMHLRLTNENAHLTLLVMVHDTIGIQSPSLGSYQKEELKLVVGIKQSNFY